MSGQLVKPNCGQTKSREVSTPGTALSSGRKTHVNHAPFPEQVLVAERVAVLVGQLERAADLGPSDAGGCGLGTFPFADLVLLGLEVEPESNAGGDEEGAGFERKGL